MVIGLVLVAISRRSPRQASLALKKPLRGFCPRSGRLRRMLAYSTQPIPKPDKSIPNVTKQNMIKRLQKLQMYGKM